jgi:hypothetical protein
VYTSIGVFTARIGVVLSAIGEEAVVKVSGEDTADSLRGACSEWVLSLSLWLYAAAMWSFAIDGFMAALHFHMQDLGPWQWVYAWTGFVMSVTLGTFPSVLCESASWVLRE